MTFELKDIIFAFSLTLFAGLSTGVGSALAFYTKQTNHKFLSAALGFSAGVMIYVSTIEIFPKAKDSLTLVYGESKGYLITTIAFFAGVALIAIIDKLVPEGENPHEIHDIPEGIAVSVPIFYATGDRKKAFRMSFISGMIVMAASLLMFV